VKNSLWREQFRVYLHTRLALPLKLALEQLYELIPLMIDDELELNITALYKVAPFLLIALNRDDEAVSFVKYFEGAAGGGGKAAVNEFLRKVSQVSQADADWHDHDPATR